MGQVWLIGSNDQIDHLGGVIYVWFVFGITQGWLEYDFV